MTSITQAGAGGGGGMPPPPCSPKPSSLLRVHPKEGNGAPSCHPCPAWVAVGTPSPPHFLAPPHPKVGAAGTEALSFIYYSSFVCVCTHGWMADAVTAACNKKKKPNKKNPFYAQNKPTASVTTGRGGPQNTHIPPPQNQPHSVLALKEPAECETTGPAGLSHQC